MKRLFSLLLPLICSLTFCGTAAQGETWRLTNDAFSDSLPQLTRDNSGRVWVAWLSNAPGNYDVYYRKFDGASWGDTLRIIADSQNQSCCCIANDFYNDRIWVAWGQFNSDDNMPIFAGYFHNDLFSNVTNIIDSTHIGERFDHFCLSANDTGQVFVAWSPILWGMYYPYSHVYLKCFNDSLWDTVQIALHGHDYGPAADGKRVECLSVTHSGLPFIMSSNKGQHVGYIFRYDLSFSYWDQDSGWTEMPITNGVVNPSPPGIVPANIACIHSSNGSFMAVFCDSIVDDSVSIICKRYSTSTYQYDTTFIIQSHSQAYSGSLSQGIHPALAWSDSHSVFLNTYYDTIWSHPPVRITDTSLHNCINPDIVAENDSTVWVCYQNDGDIYVTRTSVPLGVTGMPNSELRIVKHLALKVWPNPACNVIHFSYTLPNKRNSSVSIYDIAGRLVKTIEVKNDQINWNCADGGGRRVASGVYFAQLRSDGQETIKKISIIK